MGWLEIMAENHPIILVLLIISISLLAVSGVVSAFIKEYKPLSDAVEAVFILWVLVGFAIFLSS